MKCFNLSKFSQPIELDTYSFAIFGYWNINSSHTYLFAADLSEPFPMSGKFAVKFAP